MREKSIYWKNHPTIVGLQCHRSGIKFKLNGVLIHAVRAIEIKSENRELVTWKVYMNNSSYSPYKLTLEAWLGASPSDKRYYCRVKDGNRDNLNYTNLYWSSSLSTKYSLNNAGCKNSPLTLEDLCTIYCRYTKNGDTLRAIAKDYNCSDMSIHRAIKRYKKTFLMRK